MAKAAIPDLDWPRYYEAMKGSRQVLKRFREDRTRAIAQYAGTHWLGETSHRDFVNLLANYAGIMCRHLVPKTPRVLYSSFDRAARPVVSAMTSWANAEINRQRLDETYRRLILDALFSVGIAKVCLASPEDAALSGWGQTAGTAALWRIDLDDFVFDTSADDMREAAFIGHRYRMIFDLAQDCKRFKAKMRDKLHATGERRRFNESGDTRAGELGRDNSQTNEAEDYVDLWELYLPRHKLIVTYADDLADEPLGVQPWVGPDSGPYHILAFDVVPASAMPKGPIQDLVNLHALCNRLYEKLAQSAEAQKDNMLVKGQGTSDADRVVQAKHLDVVRVDNPQDFAITSLGGPNPANMQFFMGAQDLFNRLGGNLETLGGQSPQAKTATQEKLLNQNAGGGVADKQETTVAFMARTLEAMGWYWYNHPTMVMETDYTVPGLPDVGMTRKLFPVNSVDENNRPRPNARNVPWGRLNLRVDPYSLQYQTPQERLSFLFGIVEKMVPFLPILQQSGVVFDMQFLLQKVAEYGDAPDIPELFKVQEPVADAGGQGGGEPGRQMPPSTSREYVRTSVPGRTDRGDRQNQMAALSGVNPGGSPSTNGKPQTAGSY